MNGGHYLTQCQAVAGVYDSQKFDPNTSNFQLTYRANVEIQQPTIIFLNEKLYYPNGYNIRYNHLRRCCTNNYYIHSINPDGTGTIVKDTNMATIYHTQLTKKDQVDMIHPLNLHMYLFALQVITVQIKAI